MLKRHRALDELEIALKLRGYATKDRIPLAVRQSIAAEMYLSEKSVSGNLTRLRRRDGIQHIRRCPGRRTLLEKLYEQVRAYVQSRGALPPAIFDTLKELEERD